MKPTKVYYQCEECGAEFYRTVKEVLIDDAATCKTKSAAHGQHFFNGQLTMEN